MITLDGVLGFVIATASAHRPATSAAGSRKISHFTRRAWD
jgi:hypothetical protein